MQVGSLLGLSGPHRSGRNKILCCALIIATLWGFHVLFRQNGDSDTLFAALGKSADKWSADVSEKMSWSTVTSKLKDWQTENDHGDTGFDEQNMGEYTQGVQYERPPPKMPPKGQTWPQTDAKQQKQAQPDSYTLTTFKQTWLENEIGGPLTNITLAPISKLCASVSWHADIVLNMRPSGGGIGNLRLLILDFIYFALQTGSHMILPSYIKRTEGTLYWAEESNGAHLFAHLFDAEFLISALADACPQMRVFRSIAEAEINGTVTKQFDMKPSRTDKTADINPAALTARLRDWVDTKPEGYQDGALNMITVGVPLFTHDLRTKPKMRMALGRLTKMNNRMRELAATALFNLRRIHGLEAAIDPSKQLYRGAYYGSMYSSFLQLLKLLHGKLRKVDIAIRLVHLRTEADVGESWGGYVAQTTAHLDMCRKLNLSLIYLATGNREDTVRFTNGARELGISVVSKLDLLGAEEEQAVFDSSALESLSWDQQAVIDFEILSRSSFFSGPAGVSSLKLTPLGLPPRPTVISLMSSTFLSSLALNRGSTTLTSFAE